MNISESLKRLEVANKRCSRRDFPKMLRNLERLQIRAKILRKYLEECIFDKVADPLLQLCQKLNSITSIF